MQPLPPVPGTVPDTSISIGNGWYIGWGLADLMMAALGGAIYYFYPYKSTSTKHPYPEWTLQSYVMMGSYGGGFFFWLLNFIIGFNGNWFDVVTLYVTKIMMLAPVATLYFNF